MTASRTLAEYALGLKPEALPGHVRERALQCLIDAAACAIHGSKLPWSRMLLEVVLESAGSGRCAFPAVLPRKIPPASAALVLATCAHAFELDSLRKPGAGVHPGATVALPALVVAQHTDAGLDDLIAAIVAGCEVMFRIGDATLHSAEKAGFHAPGLTGPFGAATAAGRLLGLTAEQLTHAYGLCGSMSAGLLNFARSGNGGMVKRLHLGRAAEAGILAAQLALRGYVGPDAILEGEFGLLDAYCPKSDAARLTAGLGEVFQTETLCFKSFACHVTAQTPIYLLQELMKEHRFGGADIREIALRVSDKVLSHHSARRCSDLMLAQYSVPYSLAISAYHDPNDPTSFSEESLSSASVIDLVDHISLEGGNSGWSAALSVYLMDGRKFWSSSDAFPGCPELPFSNSDVLKKFSNLSGEPLQNASDDLLWLARDLLQASR